MADLEDRVLALEDAVRTLRTDHDRLLPVVRMEFDLLNNRVTTLQTSMSSARSEFKDEIKGLRKELKDEIKEARKEVAEHRTDLKGDIHALQDDVSAILKILNSKT